MAKKHHVPDGRAKNGGARPNSGPRPGRHVTVAREKANELCASDESPMDIMVDNMLFWHKSTKVIGAKLEELVPRLDIRDPDQIAEFQKLLRMFVNSREQAQRCAVDAAPYVHPRLAAVTIKGDPKAPLRMVAATMTAQEAAEAYASTLSAAPESIMPQEKK